MLKLKKTIIIDQDDDLYLSFPDIVKSPKTPNTFFMAYRSGDGHHPTKSNLILKKSINNGKSWETINEIGLNLDQHGRVWNCPRLSYCNKNLYIICDTKSGTYERTAQFKTVFLISKNEGKSIKVLETPIPGMVPDKIIKFKNKYFCANHKIKNVDNDLIQLVSWSNDGNIWYDTNIMAHSYKKQFCEASVVNMNDDYLIAYLRDNSGHKRHMYTVKSSDGIQWSKPEQIRIFGQRATALRYDKDNTIGAFRNTDNLNVSLFKHNVEANRIKFINIEEEYPHNQYNYGYTGLEDNGDEYLLPYYIKKDANNPYIKLAFVRK